MLNVVLKSLVLVLKAQRVLEGLNAECGDGAETLSRSLAAAGRYWQEELAAWDTSEGTVGPD